MIIDTSQSNVKVIGDVKEFKSSIDPKNLEFIATILSSNLYSNPEQSFIREIVSNAWDSHVEANNTDTPVIIKFTNSCDNKSVTIRDYGVGLSPKRFAEIYKNIGSSTKRESNNFIGCFGIGHLSPFACSSSVYITSYYNGVAYYYIGTKINNSITYHQLNELPTTEKNGVEITIKNIKNLEPYESALESIIFFPNIYIAGAINSNLINNIKIKKSFRNFVAASIRIKYKILLGNVLYPLDKNLFDADIKNFLNLLSYTGIAIKFDIGELNITPNRENIIYTTETIKKIKDRILAAKKELYDLISKKITGDYTNINEYYLMLSNYIIYDPINDIVGNKTTSNTIQIKMRDLNNVNITYKGKDLSSNLGCIDTLFNMYIPTYKGVFYNNILYCKNTPYMALNNKCIKTKKVLILNKEAILTLRVKSFLKYDYNDYSVATYFSEDDYFSYVKNYVDTSNDEVLYIIKEVYHWFVGKAKYIDLKTNLNFKEFKLSNSNKNNLKADTQETILHKINDYSREKLTFRNFNEAIHYIKKQHTGIIILNMDVDSATLYKIASLKDYIVYKAKKEVVEKINNLNLSCIISLEQLIEKNPLLSKIKSIKQYFPLDMCQRDYSIMKRNINEVELKELEELEKIYNKFYCVNTVNIVNNQNISCDPYITYLCKKFSTYVTKQRVVSSLFEDVNSRSCLITAGLIKSKVYKIRNSTYQNYKNNPIIKLLCKK